MTFIVRRQLKQKYLFSPLNYEVLKKLFLLILVALCTNLSAQHRFGVRAGLNYANLNGELEVGEDYEWASGFHFGVNYTYQFNDIFGLRTELLYTQKGARQTFLNPDSFQEIITINGLVTRFVERGLVDLSLRHTQNYFSIPITAQIQVSKKVEIFGGFSLDLLFAPTGGGTLLFESTDQIENIRYLLRLDYNFRRDNANEVPFMNPPEVTSLLIDGIPSDIFRVRGAYYDIQTQTELESLGKLYNFVDASAILGFNFFLNRAFYIGLRGELGLLDKTNSRIDFSRTELSPTDEFIGRNDRDVSHNISLSFGFRF